MSVKFISQFKDHNWFCLTLILLVSFLMMLPILVLGIPSGTDLTQHLQFASTYQHSILSGDFFPGWAASDNQGFGSIGIRFYPPIAYYLLGLSQIVINDWYYTFWLNSFWWMFIGCLGMYLWAKEFLSPSLASLAAIFYAFAPYHRYQIYHLLLFAEFAALGILPFCFYTITKLIRGGKTIDIVLFSISFALLILAHIPTTIIGSLGLGIYALILLDWKNYKTILAKLFIAFSLSLSASAFHWVRLISEINWVKHNLQTYSTDFLDFKQHFFLLSNQSKEVLPPIDNAIILLILSLLPLVFYFFRNLRNDLNSKAENKFYLALLVGGLFCLFMMTSASIIIWDNLPVLQKIQFPWRWLTAASLIGSLSLAVALNNFIKDYQQNRKLHINLGLLFFASIFFYFFSQTIAPSIALTKTDFEKEIVGLKERKGCECWQPLWSKIEAIKNTEQVRIQDRNYKISDWKAEQRTISIAQGKAQTIEISTFYYPHWKVLINNTPAEISPGDSGLISFSVPAQESQVFLYFQEPPKNTIAFYFSAFTWLLILGYLVDFLRRLKSGKHFT